MFGTSGNALQSCRPGLPVRGNRAQGVKQFFFFFTTETGETVIFPNTGILCKLTGMPVIPLL